VYFIPFLPHYQPNTLLVSSFITKNIPKVKKTFILVFSSSKMNEIEFSVIIKIILFQEFVSWGGGLVYYFALECHNKQWWFIERWEQIDTYIQTDASSTPSTFLIWSLLHSYLLSSEYLVKGKELSVNFKIGACCDIVAYTMLCKSLFQSKCLSADKYINKIHYTNAMEHYQLKSINYSYIV
jgi:hypothetical protein